MAPFAEGHAQFALAVSGQGSLGAVHLLRPLRQRAVVARLGLQCVEHLAQRRGTAVGQVVVVGLGAFQLVHDDPGQAQVLRRGRQVDPRSAKSERIALRIALIARVQGVAGRRRDSSAERYSER